MAVQLDVSPTAETNGSPMYRADIDGLRAIAITLVVCFHLKFLAGGFLGVDMFFVISGFLIVGAYKDRLSTLTEWTTFFINRAARLLPLATLVYGMCLLILLGLMGPMMDRAYLDSARAAVLFYSNFYFWRQGNYFGLLNEVNPFVHTWSLALEEQFYLVISILLFFLRRHAKLIFPLIVMSSLASALWLVDDRARFYLLSARGWEFALGAWLAIQPPPIQRKEGLSVALAGCLFIFIGLAVAGLENGLVFWSQIACSLGSVVLLMAGQVPNFMSVDLLGNKWLRQIGRASYSIYLIHWPAVVFIELTVGRSLSNLEGAALGALIFVLGTIIFKYIESPMRLFIRGLSRRRAGLCAALMIGAVVLLIAGISATADLRRHLDERVAKLNELGTIDQYTLFFEVGSCFLDRKDAPTKYDFSKCLPTGSSRHKVLILGDSFAAQRLHGLRVADKNHFDFYQATVSTCSPFAMIEPMDKCSDALHYLLPIVFKQAKPEAILLAAKWPRDFGQFGQVRFEALLKQTLLKLKESGAPVILIGATPTHDVAIPIALLDQLTKSKSVPKETRLKEKIYSDVNRSMASVALATSVPFVDPSRTLCEGDECLVAIDGVPLYFDYGHFTEAGSEHAAAPVITELQKFLK